MKILAIGAHPDDIEIFMYGLLSACKLRGDKIYLIVATDGGKGGKITKLLPAKRALETKEALKKLGAPILLNIADGELGYESQHTYLLKKTIHDINPDLIITHYDKDYHSDHRNLSKIVYQVSSHYFPIIYCDTMMGLNFDPNIYIDITPFFDDKIKSILNHKTQKPLRFSNLIKLMNSYRAAQCNAPIGQYAEAYKFEKSFPFSDIVKLLPNSLEIRPFHIENINGFL